MGIHRPGGRGAGMMRHWARIHDVTTGPNAPASSSSSSSSSKQP